MITPTIVPELTFSMPIKDYKPEMKKYLSKMDYQILYCKLNNLPYFMPVGKSCYHCGKDAWASYSPNDCQTKLITSCGSCNHDYAN